MIHPEGPRTLWASVRDDAPIPSGVVSRAGPTGVRSHPTLTALRLRLGTGLDTSGLKAEHIALRTAAPLDRAAAVALLDRLHRAVRTDRDVVVRVAADGTPTVDAGPGAWTVRAGVATWAYVRVLNDTDRDRTIRVRVGGAGGLVRTVKTRALGSASFLCRLPRSVTAAPSNQVGVEAAVNGSEAAGSIPLDLRPTWRLSVRLADGPGRVYLDDDLGPLIPPGVAGRRDLHGRWYVHGETVRVRVAGTVRVEVARGPEYEPLRVTIPPGRGSRRVVARLDRRIDLLAAGWYSADLHAHLHYGGEYLLTPGDAARAQQAEGLWFLNLAVANQESAVVHDRTWFTPHPIVATGSVTAWGEEFRNDFYGHVCLTGPDRLVEPAYSGFPGTDVPYDYPTTVHAARDGSAAGAVITSAHPLIRSRTLRDVFRAARTVEAKELPVLAALDLVDAIDVLSYPGDALLTARLWYRLLNCGFRLPATAGTDAFMNVADGAAFMTGEPGLADGSGARFSAPVGGVRAYVRADRPDRASLASAIKAGRTFVTNGPFVFLSVDGTEPGAVLERRRGAVLRVEATMASWVPVRTLELVVNGRVRRQVHIAPPPIERRVTWRVRVGGSAWVAVRVIGAADPGVMDDYAFAHSSPVYVDVEGSAVRDQASLRYFESWIDRLTDALGRDCRFADPRHEREVRELYARARRFYAALRAES